MPGRARLGGRMFQACCGRLPALQSLQSSLSSRRPPPRGCPGPPPRFPPFYPVVVAGLPLVGFFRGEGVLSGELCFSSSSAGGMLVPNNPALLSGMRAPILIPSPSHPHSCSGLQTGRAPVSCQTPRPVENLCLLTAALPQRRALLLGAPHGVVGERRTLFTLSHLLEGVPTPTKAALKGTGRRGICWDSDGAHLGWQDSPDMARDAHRSVTHLFSSCMFGSGLSCLRRL